MYELETMKPIFTAGLDRVKLADLRDNSNLSRISHPTQSDFDRIAKYRVAIEVIERLDGEGSAAPD